MVLFVCSVPSAFRFYFDCVLTVTTVEVVVSAEIGMPVLGELYSNLDKLDSPSVK
jgi:hypothetical protein